SYIDDPTGQIEIPQKEPRNSVVDFQWLRWRARMWEEYYREWTARFKKGAPDIPVTDNFSLYVSTLPRFFYAAPLDLFRFAEFFDVGGLDCGPSIIGSRHYSAYQFDLVNSAWEDKPVWVPEIYYNWNRQEPQDPGFDFFYCMGRKVSHLSIFTWPVITGKTDTKPYESDVSENKRFVVDALQKEIAEARHVDAEAGGVVTLNYVQPSVGIYWSPDIHNYAIAKGLTQEWLAGTDSIYDLDQIVNDCHFPVKLIDEQRLRKGDMKKLKVLLVGGAYALDLKTWQGMLAFADAGGTLVLVGPAGIYDRQLRPYAFAPCGDESLGLQLSGWKAAGENVYRTDDKSWAKIGKNRKIRSFGRYAEATISPAWETVLRYASGEPAVISRPQGKGSIVFAMSDIANPYSSYMSAGNIEFFEGLLEAAGVPRFCRVFTDEGRSPAPEVAVAHKMRSPGEHYIFLNNFGPEGAFHIYLNGLGKDAVIREMISGRQVEMRDDRGCSTFMETMPKHGYKVYQIKTSAINVATVSSMALTPRSGDLSRMEGVVKSDAAAPTKCAIRKEVAPGGEQLLWLSSPTVDAAVSPVKGGRLVWLSAPGDDGNHVVPSFALKTGDSLVAPDGGIKTILDLNGRSFPGVTLENDFKIGGVTDSPETAGLELSGSDELSGLSVKNALSVSKDRPGLLWKVSQSAAKPPQGLPLRLFIHANLLIGGEVKRKILFAAGGGEGVAFSSQFRPGANETTRVEGKTSWAAAIDPSDKIGVLCLFNKGFCRTQFWNSQKTFNIEIGSDPETIKPGDTQTGELMLYTVNGLSAINFAKEGMAGHFQVESEPGGLLTVLNVCSLEAEKNTDTKFIILGCPKDNGTPVELGDFSMAVHPLRAVMKSISLGAKGGGYASYAFAAVGMDGTKTILKEVSEGAADADEAKISPSGNGSVLNASGIDAPKGAEGMRLKPVKPFDLEKGSIAIKIKSTAGRDISKSGLQFINGYHGEPDYAGNRKSRLTFHAHPIAEWSPTSPMLFLTVFDREGNSLQMAAKAKLRNDEWHLFTAKWDVKAKTAEICIDGDKLVGELKVPDKWAGADPVDLFVVGQDCSKVDSVTVSTELEK
ncbi:MAG: hypothetical protein WAX69_04815, partial [Victivallales bacterium]